MQIQPQSFRIKVTSPAAQTAIAGRGQAISRLGSFTQSNATGPFNVTVNWGDGSANSSFSVAASGTIPATAHTFANAGTDTVGITITDSNAHMSNIAMFKVTVAAATASISGITFNDYNGDGLRGLAEPGLIGWGAFLDLNNNGTPDSGDIRVFSDQNGAFSFNALPAGTYHLVQLPPDERAMPHVAKRRQFVHDQFDGGTGGFGKKLRRRARRFNFRLDVQRSQWRRHPRKQ